MIFEARGYEAEGLGHVSTMKASGLAGMMKMESFIVDPFDVDAPLLSIDRIKAMGKDSLYLELYDTCLNAGRDEERFETVKERYRSLKDIPYKKNWYDDMRYRSSILKKVNMFRSADIDACISDFVDAYLELLKAAKPCDREKKIAKAREYSEGLLNNGGPATDAFLKTWGKEKTGEFFRKVLFG
ncbi:MAG: hypothetical protein IKF68_01205 [Erysipelotrichaceae bacterium]|nr:hypothetical protein [Erysipelotrichaceae bacterium]